MTGSGFRIRARWLPARIVRVPRPGLRFASTRRV